MTVVNEDSEISKKKKKKPVHVDTQMALNTWTVMLRLVHFAEGIGGKLATFADVNLIANISYALNIVVH